MISPGLELVWSLAGKEAVAAQMKEVEPDHFFCAFLKYAEISDPDLEKVAPDPFVGGNLVRERDLIRAVLNRRALSDTTKVRREIRRIIGRGNEPVKIESLHRSEATRRLFQKASPAVPGMMDCAAILRMLLESPTPAMAKVLSPAGEIPPRPAVPAVGAPSASPYMHDILGLSRNEVFDAPAASSPQIRVVMDILKSADRTPVLLVCETPVLPILGRAAQELKSERHISRIDLAAMRRDAPDEARRAQLIALALDDVAAADDRVAFFDLTGDGEQDRPWVLAALRPVVGAARTRVAVAVSTEAFSKEIETDADLVEALRCVWIHDLSDTSIPLEL